MTSTSPRSVGDTKADESGSAGAYICSRDDLHEFHYQFEVEPFDPGPEHRHGGAWSDSLAFTHCICFGAAVRAAEPLLVENETLRSVLRDLVALYDATVQGGQYPQWRRAVEALDAR